MITGNVFDTVAWPIFTGAANQAVNFQHLEVPGAKKKKKKEEEIFYQAQVFFTSGVIFI